MSLSRVFSWKARIERKSINYIRPITIYLPVYISSNWRLETNPAITPTELLVEETLFAKICERINHNAIQVHANCYWKIGKNIEEVEAMVAQPSAKDKSANYLLVEMVVEAASIQSIMQQSFLSFGVEFNVEQVRSVTFKRLPKELDFLEGLKLREQSIENSTSLKELGEAAEYAAKNPQLNKSLKKFWKNINVLVKYAKQKPTHGTIEKIKVVRSLLNELQGKKLFCLDGSLRSDIKQEHLVNEISGICKMIKQNESKLKNDSFIYRALMVVLDVLAACFVVGNLLHLYRWQIDGRFGFFSNCGEPFLAASRAAKHLDDAELPAATLSSV